MSAKTVQESQPPYPGRVAGLVPHSVPPFVGVQFDRTRKYPNGRTLRIVTHQAYNAFGLVGPEFHGVAILDEDEKSVVCDCLGGEDLGDSGYFGVSQEVWDLAWKLYTGTWEEVCRAVNAHPRRRMEVFR